ncbi:hypothetical protein J6590_050767 [Homalodisca vitripennis]|nr:hypothetical protein J6590_050767 [Homalodisca vitripennis]
MLQANWHNHRADEAAAVNPLMEKEQHVLHTSTKTRISLRSGSWGLWGPRFLYWFYFSMVRPALMFRAVVRWPKVEVRVDSLTSIQKLACLAAAAGAFQNVLGTA